MSHLETALRLDRQISGGHFAPQIRPKLRTAYEGNAQRAWRAGQYASACSSALRALKIDSGAATARAISGKCDAKAREYYEAGERAQRRDLDKAKSYWRKVLNMVPRGSTWYTKAYTSLNNAGRRRHVDEDE
jgi:tetratricopeptide (TPR) repeat protein